MFSVLNFKMIFHFPSHYGRSIPGLPEFMSMKQLKVPVIYLFIKLVARKPVMTALYPHITILNRP